MFIKNCDLSIKHGDLSIKNGDVPSFFGKHTHILVNMIIAIFW